MESIVKRFWKAMERHVVGRYYESTSHRKPFFYFHMTEPIQHDLLDQLIN